MTDMTKIEVKGGDMDEKTRDTRRERYKGKVFEKLTDAQWDAVETPGKVLVEAAAGTGKTSAMIGRIVAKIVDGVPIGRILVLVFNEAAAAEIKERLHTALFEAACLAEGEAADNLRASIDDLGSARIGTIDSFCRTVLKENFERLGISPEFEVLSEESASAYLSEALDEVFAARAAAGDEAFLELADILSPGRDEANLRKCVERMHAVYEIYPDGEEFLARAENNLMDAAKLEKVIYDSAIRGIAKVREACESARESLVADEQDKYLLLAGEVTSACDACLNGGREALTRAAGTVFSRASKRRGSDTVGVDIVKNAVARLKDIFAGWLEYAGDERRVAAELAENARYVRCLVGLTRELDERLTAVKVRDGVMSYADLERGAARLVAEGCDLGAAYDCVFVDEYQDVNRLQEYLIDSLARGDAFMVGDVKQSIYGFRLADSGVFLDRGRRYRESGEGNTVGFRSNFRSTPSILKFVNAVFDAVMTEESADVDYRRDGRFEIKDEQSVSVGESVQLHLFAMGRESKYEEGKFIGGEIKRLRGHAVARDGRRLGYGDFAVLFRTRSQAREVLRGMKDAGVPVDDGSFADESAAPERDLVNFLRVLDNPRNDLPLAGFMLSYFGNFDESELAEIAAAKGRDEDLYDAVLRAAEREDALGDKVRDMLAVLDSYRLRASFRSVPALIRSIISDYAFDAYTASAGEGLADDLAAFVTSVRTGECEFGIGAFLAEYDRSSGARKDVSYGGDKVRMSTFHGFKGLQAPVVFVAGIAETSGARGEPDEVLVDGAAGVGMRAYDLAARTAHTTLSLGAVKEIAAEKAAKEEMRLFYVAVTRPESYLYLTGSPSAERLAAFGRVHTLGRAACPLDHVSDAVCDGKLNMFVARHDSPSEEVSPVAADALPVLPEGREEDIAAIRESIEFVYPYAVSTSLAGKYSVSATSGTDEETVGVFSDKADEGTLYHRVMENIDFAAEGREGVLAEFDRMTREGLFAEGELDAVDADAIAACLATPVMREARESVCYREKPFLMTMTAREAGQGDSDDAVVIQGVIDLVIDGEKRTIVDFKNSALRSKEALEKYRKQLKLYKRAVEGALFAKVDRILLYSFKLGKFVDADD